MHIIAKLFLGTALLAGAVTGALAQAQPGDPPIPTYNDPPGPLPNPLNITMHPGSVFPENRVFGDPSKPGIYGMITTWQPGKFSRPHFHSTDRYVYVISGTWWVSDSNVFDPKTTYPIPQGTFAVDLANKVHWDGNRLGGPPAVIYIVGEGPLSNILVDPDGKPSAVQRDPRPDAAPAAARVP